MSKFTDLREKYKNKYKYKEILNCDRYYLISFIERYFNNEDVIKNKLIGLNNAGFFYSQINIQIAKRNCHFRHIGSINLYVEGLTSSDLIGCIGNATFENDDINIIINKIDIIKSKIFNFKIPFIEIEEYIRNNYSETNAKLIFSEINSTIKNEIIDNTNIVSLINKLLKQNALSFVRVLTNITNKKIFTDKNTW